MADVNINVEHLTRVEGHGNIVMNATDGTIENVQWQVSEAPRMFESFVRGRPYNELSHITSRICGICSIGHSLASLKATEAAMGIELSEQSEIIRRLAIHGENGMTLSCHQSPDRVHMEVTGTGQKRLLVLLDVEEAVTIDRHVGLDVGRP